MPPVVFSRTKRRMRMAESNPIKRVILSVKRGKLNVAIDDAARTAKRKQCK